MITPTLPPGLRPIVGASTTDPWMIDQLDLALRWAGGIGPRGEPGAHAFCGKQDAADHFCELDGEAYRWCSTQPAGGLAYCLVCWIPIFIPPETCIERIEPDAAALEVDAGSGSRRFVA